MRHCLWFINIRRQLLLQCFHSQWLAQPATLNKFISGLNYQSGINLIIQMFIGSEGLHISSAVRLGSRWSPLCQCYCVNAHVRGHTFTNNMNIFLDNTQLHWIQWIYLINPIISFEWGFLCPLVSSFLTEIGVFVPGCQAASLRGWSLLKETVMTMWCSCQPLAVAGR